jgi:hypothetical protein
MPLCIASLKEILAFLSNIAAITVIGVAQTVLIFTFPPVFGVILPSIAPRTVVCGAQTVVCGARTVVCGARIVVCGA